MVSDLEADLLRTLAWFSVMGYAPTSFELQTWMMRPVRSYGLREILGTLSSSPALRDRVVVRDGRYIFLSDLALPAEHRRRFRDATQKHRALQRALVYLKRVPGVRAIAVCNTLAWMHTRPESDIDLFVIVRDGTIWSSRLLSVSPFALMRARPGERKESPFCLSFFLSDANLSLEGVCLEDGDPYLAQWVRSLVPVYDPDQLFPVFQNTNRWADEWFPSAVSLDKSSHVSSGEGTTSSVGKTIERIARRLQQQRFPQVLQTLAQRGSEVVLTDAMLKFHTNDRREQFREAHETLCQPYSL